MAMPWSMDRTRLAWTVFGALLAGLVGFVVYRFIGTFVFGVFIYYATRPLYIRVRRRVGPPSLAAAVSLLGVALPALLLIAYTFAIALQEFNRLAARYEFASLETYIQPYIDVSGILQTPTQLLEDGGLEAIREVITQATGYIGFIGTGALHLFVMIAIAFYLLRDDYRLSRWVRRRFADDTGVFEAYADAVDRSYHQIFFGNILNAALTGTIGAIAYNVLDLLAPVVVPIPYPTLLGLLAGVASLIPIIGMKLVYFPVTIVLIAEALLAGEPGALWFPVVFAAVSFVIVDTIPDLVLRPYVSGRNLHVGMVMLAYIFGPLAFGWYGIFLGPMILVLVIHFARLVLPELMAGVPIRPYAVDPSQMIETTDSESDEVDPSQ